MNKIFKVIFNKKTGTMNVASEITKSNGKGHSEKESESNTKNAVKFKKIKIIASSILLIYSPFLFATEVVKSYENIITLDPSINDGDIFVNSSKNEVGKYGLTALDSHSNIIRNNSDDWGFAYLGQVTNLTSLKGDSGMYSQFSAALSDKINFGDGVINATSTNQVTNTTFNGQMENPKISNVHNSEFNNNENIMLNRDISFYYGINNSKINSPIEYAHFLNDVSYKIDGVESGLYYYPTTSLNFITKSNIESYAASTDSGLQNLSYSKDINMKMPHEYEILYSQNIKHDENLPIEEKNSRLNAYYVIDTEMNRIGQRGTFFGNIKSNINRIDSSFENTSIGDESDEIYKYQQNIISGAYNTIHRVAGIDNIINGHVNDIELRNYYNSEFMAEGGSDINGNYNGIKKTDSLNLIGNNNIINETLNSNVVGNDNKLDNVINMTIFGNNNRTEFTPPMRNDFDESFILGDGNELNQDWVNNFVIVGSNNKNVNANYVTIIGNNTYIDNDYAVALGNNSYAGSDLTAESFLIGGEAFSEVNVQNGSSYRRISGIAGGVEDNDAVNLAQLKLVESKIINSTGGVDYSKSVLYDDKNISDSVTLNSTVTDGVKITSLEKGAITSISKDAINGSQIFDATKNLVEYIGGGLTNTNGDVVGQILIGNNRYNSVSEAIEGESNSNHSTIDTQDSNLVIVKNNQDYNVDLSKDLNLNSIKTSANTHISNNSLNLQNGIALSNNGINANDHKVHNLNNAKITTTSTELVNGSQINKMTNEIISIIGGDSFVNNNGKLEGQFDLNGNKYDNVVKGIEEEMKNGHTNVIAGKNINVTHDSINNKYNVSLKDNLDLNSIDFNGSTINQNGLAFNSGVAFLNDKIDSNNNVIKNVANGTVSSTSQDAINGSQMFGNINNIKDIIGGDFTVVDGNISGPFVANNKNYETVSDFIEDKFNTSHPTVSTTDNNIILKTTKNSLGINDYDVGLNSDTVINQSLTFNNKDRIDSNGYFIQNGPSINNMGIDANNLVINGVKTSDMTQVTHAVNGSMLNKYTNSLESIIGGNITSNNGILSNSITVNNTKYDDIVSAIEGESKNVNVSDLVLTKVDTNDSNLVISHNDKTQTYEVKTKDDLDLNSIDFNGSKITKDSFVTNNVSLTNTGLNSGGNKVINVADGLVSSTSKEAINGGQVEKSFDSFISLIGGEVVNSNNVATGDIVINNNKYKTISEAIEAESQTTHISMTTKDSNVVLDYDKEKNNYTFDINKNLNVDSVKVNNNLIDSNGFTINKDLKIVNEGIFAGNERVINVSNAIDDYDAVNYGQLKDALNNIKYPEHYEGWTYTTNNGSTKNSVNSKDNVNFANRDGNINLSSSKNNINLDLNSKIALGNENIVIDGNSDSIKVGDTTLDKNGLTLQHGINVSENGINANNTVIKNVADATISSTSQDALNGNNIWNLNTSLIDVLGKDFNYSEESNHFSAKNIGGTSSDTISDALEEIYKKSKITNSLNGGKNIVVGTEKNSTGGFDYVIGTSNEVDFNSVKVGSTTITSNGIDAGNTKIHNVADGEIKQSSQDGINGGQLWDFYNSLKDSTVETKVTIVDDNGKQFTSNSATILGGKNITTNITDKGVEITLNDKVDVDTLSVNNELKIESGARIDMGGNIIHNVSDAKDSTDGINMGQLKDFENRMNDRVDDLGKLADGGVAAAMSLEAPPYVPGRVTYAANIAHYGSESAIGVSLRNTADNGKWSLTSGATTTTEGTPGFRVGLSGVVKYYNIK